MPSRRLRGRTRGSLLGTGPGGGPGDFIPPNIAGLALWLRADLGVTTVGGNVTQWRDQSAQALLFTGQGIATIAFLGTNAAAAASVTVTEAVGAGDTLVVVVPSLTTPTDNAGGGSNTYTLLASATGIDVYGCVSAKAASAGALVISAGAVALISYVHYSGVGSFDAATASATGTASAPNPGSLTPAAAGETIVAVTIAATVETAGSGYALRAAGSATTPAWQDLIGAAGGANATAFGTSATAWAASAIALVPKSQPPALQATGGPNGTPSLGFAQANAQFLSKSGSVLAASPWTVFLVQKLTASATEYVSFTSGDATAGISFGCTTIRFFEYWGTGILVGPANTLGWEAWTAQNTGSVSTLRVNGSANTISNSASQPPTPDAFTQIGAVSGIDTWTGSIAEIICYNSAISGAQVAQVESYLLARYGVA